MNDTDDGPANGDNFAAERERLHQEVHAVRQQRNALQAELSTCRAENSELRAALTRSNQHVIRLMASLKDARARPEGDDA